jgi:ParB family chromosome partitioning protein
MILDILTNESPPKSLKKGVCAMNEEHETRQLRLDQLSHFKNHPFELYDDKRLEDLTESIRANGVLTPIIVRPTKEDGKYEILSGHNRVEAAKRADKTEIPAVIREDLKNDDEKALLVVTLTNLQQRGFGELTHSQRAKVIRVTYDSLKRQGQRNDLTDEAYALFSDKGLLSANLKKLPPKEAVASQFGLSPNNIAYYLRLEKLIKSLIERLDNGEFELTVGEKLTYLHKDEQKLLEAVIKKSGSKVTIGKAKALVNARKKTQLTTEAISEILSYRQVRKSNHRLSLDLMEQYFTGKNPNEVDDIVTKAIEAYFQNNLN